MGLWWWWWEEWNANEVPNKVKSTREPGHCVISLDTWVLLTSWALGGRASRTTRHNSQDLGAEKSGGPGGKYHLRELGAEKVLGCSSQCPLGEVVDRPA